MHLGPPGGLPKVKLFHREMMILAVAPLYLLSESRGGLVDAAKALTLLRDGLAHTCQGA